MYFITLAITEKTSSLYFNNNTTLETISHETMLMLYSLLYWTGITNYVICIRYYIVLCVLSYIHMK